MAKFCTSCGKKLEDGKKCNCETNEIVSNNEGFMDQVKSILKKAVKIFKNPEEIIEEKNVEDKAWIITSLIQAIVSFLVIVVVVKKVFSLASDFSYLLDLGGDISLSDIPTEVYVKLFVGLVFNALVYLFTLVTAIYLVTNKILKINKNYKAILNKFSFLALISSVLVLAIAIASYIHIYVLLFVLVFGGLYYLFFMYSMFKSYFKTSVNKAILYVPLIIVVSYVVSTLILSEFLKIIFS